MPIIRLWNYFRGYVIIKVEGLTLERFINLAISKDIFLWDIVRLDYTTLEAKVSIKGFRDLKEIVRTVGCRISIKDKNGFPFFASKFKYRKMLLSGFGVAIALIIYLTSFIWSIEIIGNEKIKEEKILADLKNINVKLGIKKSKLDTDKVKGFLLSKSQEFSYVSVYTKGTKLIVDVKERDIQPERIEDDTPCNIVSKKKAVIEKVIAKNGKRVVEKGDIVKKGQVLISGIIQDESMEESTEESAEEPFLVHSNGSVLGRTWYKEVVKEPLIKTIKEETGKIHTSRELKIGDRKIQLMKGEIPFKHYIEEKKVKKLLKTSVFELPIEVIIHTYKEVNLKQVTQNSDSLKEINEVKGTQALMKKLPKESKVISKDVKHQLEDKALTTEIIVEVEEEIGQKEKIR
ncbi:sporulation protein YqfD [Gottschalkia purinilytica]|uniref:Sporulation protein YqfD n=1 Tax=Gottschalkia purinilytica TaxID=1503 RepID=A0A0L0WD03_GOTPU|nr:sporulation protein YqfD [Gottschalkia purinilytica]KNF09348.1 sporulation protein YqfD [Gottschalkia purinilytica]